MGPRRPPFPHGLRAAFLDRLEGTIVALGPERQAPRPRSLSKPLVWAAVVFLLPVLLATAIALRFLGWKGQGTGLFRNLLLLNVPRLMRPPEAIPAWDLRLRDACGEEHAAFLQGRDASGPPSPGDFVVLWGRMRRGTLAVEMGFNGRTGSWMYL
jgi:hypothetical protein